MHRTLRDDFRIAEKKVALSCALDWSALSSLTRVSRTLFDCFRRSELDGDVDRIGFRLGVFRGLAV
jgi:hypothetical protein